MTKIFQRQWLLTLIFSASIISCKVYTSKTIYKSDSPTTHWTIQSLNVENCKCSELYISHYKDKEIDFKIFYADKFVRKTIYSAPGYSQRRNVKILLATEKDNYLIPLDSVDKIMFSTIAILNKNDSNIIYKLKDRQFKGYLIDSKPD